MCSEKLSGCVLLMAPKHWVLLKQLIFLHYWKWNKLENRCVGCYLRSFKEKYKKILRQSMFWNVRITTITSIFFTYDKTIKNEVVSRTKVTKCFIKHLNKNMKSFSHLSDGMKKERWEVSAERKAFAFYMRRWWRNLLRVAVNGFYEKQTIHSTEKTEMFSPQPSFIIISYNKLLDQTSCKLSWVVALFQPYIQQFFHEHATILPVIIHLVL